MSQYIENAQDIIDGSDIKAVAEKISGQRAKKSKLKCLFHDDNTPSMQVNENDGTYYCHSCGAKGNVITMLKEIEGFDYVEAVEWLAKENNIIVEYSSTGKSQEEVAQERKARLDKKLKREQLYEICNTVAEAYAYNYGDEEEISIAPYKPYKAETLKKFDIGLSPQSNFFTDKVKENTEQFNLLQEIGVIRKGEYGHYDFFKNRQIFPVRNIQGKVIALGARKWTDENKKVPKYINSSESKVFTKGEHLYGLYENEKAIKKAGFAYMVEGYTDVLSLVDANINNVVGSMGTSLTKEQLKLLKRFTNRIVFFYDGDDAGIKATLKGIELALEEGFYVEVLPLSAKEDPDSLIRSMLHLSDERKRQFNFYVQAMKVEGVEFSVSRYLGENPSSFDKSNALGGLVELLYKIQDSRQQITILNEVCAKFKFKVGDVKRELSDYEKEQREIEAEQEPKEEKKYEHQYTPEQEKDIMLYGCFEEDFGQGKRYQFISDCGYPGSEKSNYTITPQFLVKDKKRFILMTNVQGETELVELEIEALVNLKKFKVATEGKGEFWFTGSEKNFEQIKKKIYREEKKCVQIDTLGWQPKLKFWAWANGISDGSTFYETDSRGIVEYKGKCYFIPMLSSVHIDNEESYEDEKRFIHMTDNKTSFKDWAKTFHEVYDKNGMIGMCFFIATLFRDIHFKNYDSMPLLFCYGMKGTGKSEMGMSLYRMFSGDGSKPEIMSIAGDSTTKAILATASKFRNVLVLFEEFKNSIIYRKIELLKGFYNGYGYKRRKATNDKQTISTRNTSTAIITGQEMPTIEEALYERNFILEFVKREYNMKAYRDLKLMQNNGLTSVVNEILQCREHFEANLHTVYEELYETHKYLVENEGLSDRELQNMIQILASRLVLDQQFNWPFKYLELEEFVLERVRANHEVLGSGLETQTFFKMVFESIDRGKLFAKADYFIKRESECEIIVFRIVRAYMAYEDLYGHKSSSPVPEGSLKNYLKHHPAFIEIRKNCRFKAKTSGWVFNYTLLKELGYVINIDEREESKSYDDRDIQELREQLEDALKENSDLKFILNSQKNEDL